MSSREPRSIALTLLSLAAVAAGPPSTAAKADDTSQTPAPGRMFVVGRVLNPRGNPVPGATVMVHARNLTPGRASFLFPSRVKLIPLGDARADGSGRFRIDAPGRPRHDTRISAPSRWRPAMASAGSRSIPTTISPPPRSRSGRSR